MSKLLFVNIVKTSFILFGIIPIISVILFGSMPIFPSVQTILNWIGTELALGIVLFLSYLIIATLRALSKRQIPAFR